jgi:GAF domain-containing protein
MEHDDGPDRVRHALELAARETSMDVAFVSDVANDRETVLWASRSAAYPDLRPGATAPLADTVCCRVLEGRVPGVIADTARAPALRDVPLVRDGAIGAYLGVPLRTADAHLYMLCCLARERRPQLGGGDLRFLAGVAETVRAVIDPN